MFKRWYFSFLVFCWFFLVASVSLEDIAREYRLSLRYDWNLGCGELKSEKTNRFCRVYFTIPYIVVDGKIYYFDEGVRWETNGSIILSSAMEKVVRDFAGKMKFEKILPMSGETIETNLKVSNQLSSGEKQTHVVQSSSNLRSSSEVKTNETRIHLSPTTTNRLVEKTNEVSPELKKTNQREASIVGRDLFRPIYTIILDPGHGGKDPGGIGRNNLKEKEIVLHVAQLLKKELEDMGYRVLLTRSLDRYVSLSERIEIAYEKWHKGEGAIFVSIHGNISLNPTVRGIEIYYLSDKASDAGASAVEIAENAGFSMDDIKHTESFYSVLNVLMREGVSKISRALAEDAKKALAKRFPFVSVKSANFYVLRFSPLPAILWEIGYLSHKEEVNQLNSEAYQRQLVKSMASGLNAFIRRYNARRGTL